MPNDNVNTKLTLFFLSLIKRMFHDHRHHSAKFIGNVIYLSMWPTISAMRHILRWWYFSCVFSFSFIKLLLTAPQWFADWNWNDVHYCIHMLMNLMRTEVVAKACILFCHLLLFQLFFLADVFFCCWDWCVFDGASAPIVVGDRLHGIPIGFDYQMVTTF